LGVSAVPAIGLNDGHSIPQLGFGVFQVPPPDTEAATTTALGAGYRHIDTAEMYGNERAVGDALRAAGLDRSEVYVTSKLNNGFHEPDAARRAFDETLATLGFDYVDLFLITGPCRRSTTATSSRRGRRSRSSSRTAGRGRSASRTSRFRISSASPPKGTSCRR
jgi:diketogulonate reductase-like aldo/keto reductase